MSRYLAALRDRTPKRVSPHAPTALSRCASFRILSVTYAMMHLRISNVSRSEFLSWCQAGR